MGNADQAARSVLIVDDDLRFAESLADLLQARGYSAHYCDNSEHALEALREPTDGGAPAPVALIDVRLGGSELGVDLIPRLCAEQPELVSVLMTTAIDTPTAIAGLRGRAYDYFDKSSEPDALFAVLDRCFEHVALQRDHTPRWYRDEAARLRQKAAHTTDDVELCDRYVALAREYEQLVDVLERHPPSV